MHAQIGKWLVMFCDEINLPDMDAYGTQRVISFLRQLVEYNGFYRVSDQVRYNACAVLVSVECHSWGLPFDPQPPTNCNIILRMNISLLGDSHPIEICTVVV